MSGLVLPGLYAANRKRTADLDPETVIWKAGVLANGGTLAVDSVSIADALIIAIKAATYNAKILWLAPLLGSNLSAARMPLRDSLARGWMSQFNLVNGDYTQATGLQFDGSTKRLLTGYATGDLNGNFGGLGVWDNNNAAGSHYMMGARGATLSMLFKDSTTPRALGYFATGNVQLLAANGNDHLYIQSKSTTDLTLYKNGVNSATTASNSGSFTNGIEYNVGAVDGSFFGNIRAVVAYMTNGQMTDPEIAAFHTLLGTYLKTPTGR